MIIILWKVKQKSDKKISMVSYRVRTCVLSIIKVNAPNERIYQVSHDNNRESTPGFKVLC